MNITIREMSLDESLESLNAYSMAEEHHTEVEDGLWTLDPDLDMYNKLYESGVLIITGVFNQGILVGYSVDQIIPSIHYKGRRILLNDLIYLKPEYRNKGVFPQLIKYMLTLAVDKKFDLYCLNMKVKTPCSLVLSSLGFSNNELVWSKKLEY